jgi:hypothetical protein
MSDSSSPLAASSPFTIGELFAGTFRAWAAGLSRWVALSLIFYAPLIALGWLALHDGGGSASAAAGVWSLVRGLLLMAVSMLASAAVVFGTVKDRRGSPASVGDCVSAAFSAFWPILGMSILVQLIAVLFMLPILIALIVVIVLRVLNAARNSTSHVVPRDTRNAHAMLHSEFGLWTIGSGLACVILAAIAQARFFVSSATILVEGRGVTASLGESSRLTKGHRTMIWVFVSTLLLCGSAVGFCFVWFIEDTGVAEALSLAFSAVVATPLMACASAVAYEELKRRKDGVDIATLGRIFE